MTVTVRRVAGVVGAIVLVVGALGAVPVPVLAAEEVEPNDSMENANDLGESVEMTGEVATGDDEDWFVFTAERGETVNVTARVPSDSAGTPYFQLRNASDNFVGTYGTSGEETRIGFTARQTGTYYLRVYYEVGSYSVTLNTEQVDPFEPNENLRNAVPVTLGQPQSGTVTLSDQDWFSFDATRGETILVNATVPEGVDSPPFFQLWNASENLGGEYGSSGETVTIGTTVRQSETHHLRVYYDTGPYTFTVRTITTDPFEPNEERETARPLYANPFRPSEARLTPGDVDWFAVRAQAGEEIRVAGTSETEQAYVDIWSTEQQNGTYLDGQETGMFTAPSAGVYYLQVYYDRSSYALDATVGGEPLGFANDRFERPHPPMGNQDPARATELGPGTYEDLGMVDDDRDVFALELTANESMRAEVSFTHDRNDLALALTDASGETVASADSGSDGEAIEVTPDANGTYYLVVSGEQGASATYDLSVSGEVAPASPDTGYGSLDGSTPEPVTATPTPASTAQPSGDGTATATATVTPVPDETVSGETEAADEDEDGDGEGGSSGFGPGFGVAAALLALLAVGLAARRR